jgi:serine/threonine protein kinase
VVRPTSLDRLASGGISESSVAHHKIHPDNLSLSVIGTSIGNYQIQRLIGEGGMGKVYLAEHPGIGRQAAVKVLTPSDAADPQIVSRFITEARAANSIRHPNIVDIYDSGVLEGGTPYIVMEFLNGETLKDALARGPLPLADAIDWGCQIAEALAAAHAADIVHRDLKPDNLFLIPDPRRLGKKQIKVLDFGIAKLQRRTLNQVHKTRTGALMGTPLYMSPEQCMSQKDIDARTDIYSLGVILYEMAAGRRPFDDDGVYALISMHINVPPAPPTSLRPEVPRDLEAIIMQALAKAPADRQESMAILLSQLELTRGNSSASSDALMRVQHERFRPVPLSPSRQVTLPEIKTLGDTAVSKQVTGKTGFSRSSARMRLALAGGVGVVLVGIYALGPFGAKPAVPLTATALVAPAATAPAPPQTLAAPPSIEIGLDSEPTGASVFVGDVLVGTTPTKFKAEKTGEPVDFTFRAQGFEAEKIRALPAQGLTISAKFSTPSAAKPTSSAKRKRAATAPSGASPDIQTER